jgi:hypothetical protein
VVLAEMLHGVGDHVFSGFFDKRERAVFARERYRSWSSACRGLHGISYGEMSTPSKLSKVYHNAPSPSGARCASGG